jgi:SnoaL-like domain
MKMKRLLVLVSILGIISTAIVAKLNAQQSKPIEHSATVDPEEANLTAYYDGIIDRYFESLNETDAQQRRKLIEQVWTETGTFAYPFHEVKGFAAITDDIERVQKKYPGAKVRRTSEVSVIQGDYVRFNWDFAEPNKETLIRGVDFAVIRSGKLDLIAGFFDYRRDAKENKSTGN